MTSSILLAATLGLSATQTAGDPADMAEPVRAVFRVFEGTEEVTAETRLGVRVSGSAEDTVVLKAPPLAIDLAPGIYDAQAIRHRGGRVLGVRWAERLVIVRYPDERQEHLQVINMKPGFGALQLLIPPEVRPDPAMVTIEGTGTRPAARIVGSKGYLLIVAPAGTYDITVSLPAGKESLAAVEIPADRTRMRPIGGEPQR